MITVLTVNYNSPGFVRMLLASFQRGSGRDQEFLVVDNSDRTGMRIQEYGLGGARTIPNAGDRSHGAGLNLGLRHVKTEHVLILDADCHSLSDGWVASFLAGLDGHYLVGVHGSESKPLRAACVFMGTQDARAYDWRATPGYKGNRVTPEGFDVGIGAYHQMVAEGKGIRWMETVQPSRYGTLNGEEYGLDGNPLIYHHWHGTHLESRAVDYPGMDLLADKAHLMRSVPWCWPKMS